MSERDFQVGDRVNHPDFGVGLVLEALGKGEQAAVVVSFDDKVRRKLAVRFAKLKLVEPPSAPERKS